VIIKAGGNQVNDKTPACAFFFAKKVNMKGLQEIKARDK